MLPVVGFKGFRGHVGLTSEGAALIPDRSDCRIYRATPDGAVELLVSGELTFAGEPSIVVPSIVVPEADGGFVVIGGSGVLRRYDAGGQLVWSNWKAQSY